ncbi:hypothetical protein D3C76_1102600 [compost metagenome]
MLKCPCTAERAGVTGHPCHGIQIPPVKRLPPQRHDRFKFPDVFMRLAQKCETDVAGRAQQISQVGDWNAVRVVYNNNQRRLSLFQKSVECPNGFVSASTRQQNFPNTFGVFLGVLGGKLAHD